ncbi:hypothetical protein PsorP6_013978 [Peronosclerospora sorghi]|uniref:Uncharacterized protein n=1 Tax=Peronosclerospora sorghi TaxID=230839 RepID=A0ACC0VJ89_9STRA|nr:hypothetical protein PsorP6_013978 [Peronosclerospora sorghi]
MGHGGTTLSLDAIDARSHDQLPDETFVAGHKQSRNRRHARARKRSPGPGRRGCFDCTKRSYSRTYAISCAQVVREYNLETQGPCFVFFTSGINASGAYCFPSCKAVKDAVHHGFKRAARGSRLLEFHSWVRKPTGMT